MQYQNIPFIQFNRFESNHCRQCRAVRTGRHDMTLALSFILRPLIYPATENTGHMWDGTRCHDYRRKRKCERGDACACLTSRVLISLVRLSVCMSSSVSRYLSLYDSPSTCRYRSIHSAIYPPVNQFVRLSSHPSIPSNNPSIHSAMQTSFHLFFPVHHPSIYPSEIIPLFNDASISPHTIYPMCFILH